MTTRTEIFNTPDGWCYSVYVGTMPRPFCTSPAYKSKGNALDGLRRYQMRDRPREKLNLTRGARLVAGLANKS